MIFGYHDDMRKSTTYGFVQALIQMRKIIYSLVILIAIGCSNSTSEVQPDSEKTLYLGGDFSYINEMEDCGATYQKNGTQVDPYELFAEKGANLARIRLWHNPDWTDYSTFSDVVKSIGRAKRSGMKILLDFHYSDTWADPGDQIIPAAWRGIEDLNVLGDSVYQYTYQTLIKLHDLNLTPEIVQVGNETNSEILLEEPVDETTKPINWTRNVFLLNKGISAVRDASKDTGFEIETMLHIAQPENAIYWFDKAFDYQIDEFEWIGLSYYPLWSEYKINEAAGAIDSLIKLFKKRIMVVETAYPYIIEEFDGANNILWETAVLPGYPATPEGQKKYMLDLTKQVIEGGGEGVIYWEPAWVSTGCNTRWGTGSHWENATFFDAGNNNEVLPAFAFFDQLLYQD